MFAATADAVKQLVYNYYGNTNSEGPIIFAAALSTVLVNPIQEWITRWSENRFQKNLVILRDELPDTVRDLRETANLARADRRHPRPHHQGRPHHAYRRDHRPGRVPHARDGEGQGRGMAERRLRTGTTATKRSAIPTTSCSRSASHCVPGEGEDTLGYLLVGPRPDGSVISHDEQKALKEVAEPIARAIRNVIRRVAYERRLESMIESSARRLDELEARINGPSVTAVPSSRSA